MIFLIFVKNFIWIQRQHKEFIIEIQQFIDQRNEDLQIVIDDIVLHLIVKILALNHIEIPYKQILSNTSPINKAKRQDPIQQLNQISYMSLQQFLSQLEEHNISQIICLVSQLVITIHTIVNLRRNEEEFPVKQLSPLLSLYALLSFFILNCISYITRIIEQKNGYYKPDYTGQNGNCGQCRLYGHTQMIILAFLYNGLRQLPLIIFIIKTYRVCLCYKIKYDKQLSQNIISLFSNQKRLLLLSCFITLIFMLGGYFVFGEGNPYNGNLVFEFFCPKESSVYDWIVTALRFAGMAYVYTISVYTYNQLDFKKFLFLIFILTNTEVLLRMFLVLSDISRTTYLQFYYHSFVMNLFGTLIMFYYSTIKEQRNRPLSLPILQSFKAFLQTTLGFSVMTLFAMNLDKENDTKKYLQTFQAYIRVEEISMLSYQDNYKIKEQYIPELIDILNNVEVLQDLQDRKFLIKKCQRQEINALQLREVERKLSTFCQRHIFNQWRQTQSSKYLENQFRNNGVINLRMNNLGIQL